jgi:hypothetical protein
MVYPRSNHGICYSQEALYVVGGSSNDEEDVALDRCEKFDF